MLYIPECFCLTHSPAPHASSLTLLCLHPLALQQADVESLLCVLMSDVLSGSQHLQRVPGCLDVTSRAYRSLVLHHLRRQPERKPEVKGYSSHNHNFLRVVALKKKKTQGALTLPPGDRRWHQSRRLSPPCW